MHIGGVGVVGPRPRRLCYVATACAVFCLATTGHAAATQSGIVGNSGKQGTTCNDSCHADGVPPLVRFEGPHAVMADALATFRFVVESQSPRQTVAGFNVAASDGVLGVVPGQGARVEADEITHEAAKPNTGGEASWQFTWRAPNQLGAYTLYGAGLSANGNGSRPGDDSATTTLGVTVTPNEQPGDANCDRRLTAADLTAIVTLLPSGVPAGCNLADADGDGFMRASDLALVVATLFEG